MTLADPPIFRVFCAASLRRVGTGWPNPVGNGMLSDGLPDDMVVEDVTDVRGVREVRLI